MKKVFTIIVGAIVLFAINTIAQPGHTKQADMTGKDPYADAPWRMKKTDTAGNLKSIPVHIFIHDANLIGHNAELIGISVKLKNAADVSFGQPVVFNNYSDSAFALLFTSKSMNDADFYSQSFDQGLPVKSADRTVQFTETPCSWPYSCSYVDINRQYWYFTLNIPPDKLAGYSDIIDMEVTFELNWETDESIRLRVFRYPEEMPKLSGWYRGDTHFHSMYTTNEAEFGLPLNACSEAAKLVGLDWITVTDHSTDFDNQATSMQDLWNKEGAEVFYLNSLDTSFVFIRGLEVSCLNSAGDVVHLLTYPSVSNPGLMPFVADGGGDLTATHNIINDFILNLQQNGGFAYAAHPFAEGDELSSAIGGGIWNINDSTYYLNGSAITGAGTVICNDLATPSDIYLYQQDSGLLRPALKGGELWNAYYALTTTSDYTDPWDATDDFWVTPFQPMAANDIDQHLFRMKHGLDVADHINQRGLKIKDQNWQEDNYRFFISAGSDAHGSFNYSSTDFVMGVSGFIDDNAIGKLNTLVYCPSGMGTNGSNILKAMRDGNMILSDGPIVYQGIDLNSDHFDELVPGQDTLLNDYLYASARLNLNAFSDSSFGTFDTIVLVICTEDHKFIKKISFPPSYQKTFSFDLDSLVNNAMSPDTVMCGEFFFIRAELKTSKSYGPLQALYCTSGTQFNSFTNPLWIGRDTVIITGNESRQQEQFIIFPNPVHERIYIRPSLYELCEVGLYDIMGRLVGSSKVNSRTTFSYDVSGLLPGVYFLHLKTGAGVSVYKIIVN